MSAARRPVKRTREYDASGRQERAREVHDKTLDVAAEAFLADGYEATTVAAIAAHAGVSEATIYKSYGGKAGLVRELCHRALTWTRSDTGRRALERTPHRQHRE